MKPIPTKVHGVLDYASGVLFIASPWLFNFDNGGAAQWVPIAAGIAILGLSALTDYEAGLLKQIPMPVHLTMDILMGVLLVASPWIFGFSDTVNRPHLIFGLMEIGAGLLTRRMPSYSKNSQTAY